MREQQKQIWIYGFIHIKNSYQCREKQCNVSSFKNNLQFAFKGPKYARDIFLSIFLQIFGNIKKAECFFFSHTEYYQKAQNFSDHFLPEICLQLVFFESFKET